MFIDIKKCVAKWLFVGAATVMATFQISVHAQGPTVVKTVKDSQGWKLKVNGRDFYIKGVVWGYTPREENYSYNIWAQDEAFIKKVIDHEFGLMKKAGVNAIRSFSSIPAKWVTYIYNKYGIMTAINPLMGRYGASINGVWVPNTNYADPVTRAELKKEVLKDVRKYKDVPGLLMFALGNESNYGLSWSSFEIENLPVGEQNKKKAEYLYSLFDEVMQEGKAIDPNHPFTIVNGDLQYIDVFKKYRRKWDLLGVNAYRGVSFTDMWQKAGTKLGLPIVLFEFGSDSFNAKSFKEDQLAQAQYLKGQWSEMYSKSHGNGEEGNSLGGFVFQWRDGWWKFKQTENLDKQDTNASWENGGYKFDHVKGRDNMNEEWFGIARMGPLNKDGFYEPEPRAAYHVLSEVWKIDPYKSNSKALDMKLNAIDVAAIDKRTVKPKFSNRLIGTQAFGLSGGQVKLDYVTRSDLKYQPGTDEADKRDTDDDSSQQVFLDFAFEPNARIEGDFTVNYTADTYKSGFEHRYGDRLFDKEGYKSNKLELYDFQAKYKGDKFDLLGFYHVPRYHWVEKGDLFGLLRETTDMEGQDIWSAKAPRGIEFIGKKSLDGLNIVAGPEVYWGANPKAILKYQFGKNKRYTLMHSEEYDVHDDASGNGSNKALPKSNQTTLSAKLDLGENMKLQVGGMVSNQNKVDDTYYYYKNGERYRNKVEFEDTLAFKSKLTHNAKSKGISSYVAYNYGGVVADGGDPTPELGTGLPYSGLGNKHEFEVGALISRGDFIIVPRLFSRRNLVDANPGKTGRSTDNSPFVVLGNRAADSAEVFLTYDPTPATPFYDWDNDAKEDAKFAYNVGLTRTLFKTGTDKHHYYNNDVGQYVPFGEGIPKDAVSSLKSKMVFNPNAHLKAIANFEVGEQQTSGSPEKAINFYTAEAKFVLDKQNIINVGYKRDAWGPYDYDRDFNTTYPEQIELGFTRLLDKGRKEKSSSKIGFKAMYRTLDENPTGDSQGGLNDDVYEVKGFYEHNF